MCRDANKIASRTANGEVVVGERIMVKLNVMTTSSLVTPSSELAF